MNYRLVGHSRDGLLIFQDLEYPSDAPQGYPTDDMLRHAASSDAVIDGEKYFCVTERHAQVRGMLARVVEG